ncbi:hypothetical protein H0H87_003285, partial [Tephrocybe sp. NHM501043]
MSHFLPYELVDLVIDELADDRMALRACTTVCRSWTARSRYLLFSDVLLRGRNCDNIMGLQPPSAFSVAARRLMVAERDALPPGIEHFTSVKSLYLTMSTPITETIIKIPLLFSTITTFELNQVVFDSFVDIVQFMCALPCLETYTHFMCPWKQEISAPSAHFRLPENLQNLNFASLRLHVFLEWFNSLETLPPISTVRLYGVAEPHTHSVGAAIKRLGGFLRHLTLDLWEDGST